MTAPRLVVVGGGVAGLAAARAARRAAPPDRLRVTLLEGSERLGGKIFTEMVDGVPWEWGPDALVATKPRGRDLLEELGLLGEAVAPATGRAYLLHRGKLKPLPPGTAMGIPKGPRALVAAARAGILSPGEALRAVVEPLLPRRPVEVETLGEVARERFGAGVAEKLVAPLAGNVYGVDVNDLDLRAVLPEMADARSLMLRARRRPPVRFLGLRGGMGRLVDALAADLAPAEVRTGVRARALVDLCGRYTVRTDAGPVEADALVLAVPGPIARTLLLTLGLPGGAVGMLPFTNSAVVNLRYGAGDLGRPLDGAGYVSAVGEPGVVSACSWVTAKWGREMEAGLHLRAVAPGWAGGRSDPELLETVVEEVGRVMRASAPPLAARLHRWRHALPEFRPEHGLGVRRLRRALPPGVQVAGATYDGVGIPDCVASGEAAARRLLRHLGVASPGRPG